MSKKLTIGIIGCGGITAFSHLPALSRYQENSIDIKYLCDIKESRVDTLKSRFNLHAAQYIKRYQELVEKKDIDAIIIAAWPTNNADIAIEAIRNQKHVLIQKPLTLNSDTANKFLEISKDTTKKVLALPLIKSISSIDKLKTIIESGSLGQISYSRIRTSIQDPRDYYSDVQDFFFEEIGPVTPYMLDDYANSIGCSSDMGPYALSAYYFLFGKGNLLFAQRSNPKFETASILLLDIPKSNMGEKNDQSTPICSIEIGWKQVRAFETISVFGSIGTAVIGADGCLSIFSKDGKISNIDCQENQPTLPIPPVTAQEIWLDSILSEKETDFNKSVESASWVSSILSEVIRRY